MSARISISFARRILGRITIKKSGGRIFNARLLKKFFKEKVLERPYSLVMLLVITYPLITKNSKTPVWPGLELIPKWERITINTAIARKPSISFILCFSDTNLREFICFRVLSSLKLMSIFLRIKIYSPLSDYASLGCSVHPKLTDSILQLG